jgi:phosphoglycolate phosphatase-like HAD superfamily hydrolase
MVGDTTYDIEMGRAAGMPDDRRVLGVSPPVSALREAGADDGHRRFCRLALGCWARVYRPS